MEFLGVRLVGFNLENGQKLLLTVIFVLALIALRGILLGLVRGFIRPGHERAAFWVRQAVSLVIAAVMIVGILSIWFDDPTRLTTAAGLVTAGLAFALQKVITAIAGYFVILRGNTFSVGDRITMGGVRGDVIALGFIQTTIMEMGQPPAVQGADPAMWVRSRQFTGRIVTVTNDKVFDEPIYNYTREFPFLWEEISVPIPYRTDRDAAEQILLDAAREHGLTISKLGDQALRDMRRRYFVHEADVDPKVFYRLTDNWLELTVRFLADSYGVRVMKDAMSRQILKEFDRAGIGLASTTFEIVGFPPVQVSERKIAGKDQARNESTTVKDASAL